MTDFIAIRDYANKCHENAGCKYDKQPYIVHIDMVVGLVNTYKPVFLLPEDADNTLRAAYCHDLIEDTTESYNDVMAVIGKKAADIVLAVTDVTAENRLMKHLLTMGKTVMNYRAIILKMCDIGANARYSKIHNSSMYPKYVEEYRYRRAIFQKALTWNEHKSNLSPAILNQLWKELDSIHLE